VKATAVVLAPLQRTWFDTTLTVGVGFTVMVKVLGVPGQEVPPLVITGVTVMVAVIGAIVKLLAVNEMFPVPLAANPIEGSLFVQV
jgi:hypothetical protein